MRTQPVEVHFNPIRAYKQWEVSARDHQGRPHRKSFFTQAEAETYAVIIRGEIATDGARAMALRYEDRRDAAAALELLAPYGVSILKAVQHYVEYRRLNEKSCTVRELVEFFLFDKENEGVTEVHLKSTRLQLEKFARTFGKRTVASITFTDVRDWLMALPVETATKISYRRALKSFFQYGYKRKYTPANPVDDVKLPRANPKPIEIFTVEEMKSLLGAADPATLPFLAIGGFSGLRSAEIFRLKWEDIRWEQGVIEVSAKIAKTRQSRFVPMSENLKAWLKPYASVSGPIIGEEHHKTFYRRLLPVAKRAGLKWKPNALRHSYGSYRSAVLQDVNKVSWEMGNSPDMVFKHYRAPVLPQVAEAWWQIFPTIPHIALAAA